MRNKKDVLLSALEPWSMQNKVGANKGSEYLAQLICKQNSIALLNIVEANLERHIVGGTFSNRASLLEGNSGLLHKKIIISLQESELFVLCLMQPFSVGDKQQQIKLRTSTSMSFKDLKKGYGLIKYN